MLGISMIVHAVAGLPIGAVNLAVNVPVMLLCTRIYGKKILFYTIFMLVVTSVLIDGLANAFRWFSVTNPWLLSAIGAVPMGFGAGLIMRCGGTMGGTSALGTLLRRPFPRLRLDVFMLACDAVILSVGAVLLHSLRTLGISILYAVVCYMIMGRFTEHKKSEAWNT